MSEFVVFFPGQIKYNPSRLFALSDGVQMAGPAAGSESAPSLSLSFSGTESRPVKWACSTVRMGYPRLDHVYDRRLDDARRWSLAIHECAKKVIECNGVKEVVVLRGNEEADGE